MKLKLLCPYSIIDQFDEWWDWHRKVHYDKELPGAYGEEPIGSLKWMIHHAASRMLQKGTLN